MHGRWATNIPARRRFPLANLPKASVILPRAAETKTDVIVGRFVDFPLAKQFLELASVPERYHELTCYLFFGSREAQTLVSQRVFRAKETIEAELAPFERTLHAALTLTEPQPGNERESQVGFHANLSADELRRNLEPFYRVVSPSVARMEWMELPEETLSRVVEAARWNGFAHLTAALERALTTGDHSEFPDVDGSVLSQFFVNSPEHFNQVDHRLFALWAAHSSTTSLLPPFGEPERGFDRFATLHDLLVASGFSKADALRRLLFNAPKAKHWCSTGLFTWRYLRDDPEQLLALLEGLPSRDALLGHLMQSVANLPKRVLECDAGEVLRDVCRSHFVSNASYGLFTKNLKENERKEWLDLRPIRRPNFSLECVLPTGDARSAVFFPAQDLEPRGEERTASPNERPDPGDPSYFSTTIWVEDGQLERAIRRARQMSTDIFFELTKRFRYGPKPSVKRRNKHKFRGDFFNPEIKSLSKSWDFVRPEKSDRAAGKACRYDRHWL